MAYQLRQIDSDTLAVDQDKNCAVFDGTYWWVGGDGDLFLVSFDGTTITVEDTVNLGATVYNLVFDGTYVHAATSLGVTQLRAYSRTGNTIDAVIDTHNTSTALAIDYDGAYIYVGSTDNNVYALSFNGTNYTQHDTINLGANVDALHCAGGVIYAATPTTVYALTFDGANLSNDGNTGAIMTSIYSLAHDGTYLHVGGSDAGGADIESFTYAGGVFTAAATHDIGSAVHGVIHDGTYLHVASGDGYVRSFTHDGAAYTQIASIVLSTVNIMNEMGFNATYILATSDDNSVYAVQMSLKANIVADPRRGTAPLSVQFTAG